MLNKGYHTQASKDFGINRETLWRKISYPLPQISSLHINVKKFGKKKWPLLAKIVLHELLDLAATNYVISNLTNPHFSS